jgi:hypothetical protein
MPVCGPELEPAVWQYTSKEMDKRVEWGGKAFGCSIPCGLPRSIHLTDAVEGPAQSFPLL